MTRCWPFVVFIGFQKAVVGTRVRNITLISVVTSSVFFKKTALKVDTDDLCYDPPNKVRMSAEIETNPEDDVKGEKRPIIKLKSSLRFYIQFGLYVAKILELFICIITMCFMYEPIYTLNLGNTHLHHVGVMYTTIAGYMLINGVTLAGAAFGDRMPYRMSSLFAVMGSALFLVTGILLNMDRSHHHKNYYYLPGHLSTMMTTLIVFVFVNVILFAADAVFNLVMFMSQV